MPLIEKPRDPNAWIKKPRKRKPKLRKKLEALVLPETKAYIASMRDIMPAGRLIDEAIKFYREVREHEQSNQTTG